MAALGLEDGGEELLEGLKRTADRLTGQAGSSVTAAGAKKLPADQPLGPD